MNAIWEFLAGIGFFLFGMSRLEFLLKKNSGRSLKLFLRRNTQSLFKSIGGGAIITGLLQSSSVVSLMVLAFVESGLITFRNALGVILGTNLGTTLDSWIVATLGFKFDLLNFALPVIAISSIGMFISGKHERLERIFNFLFALGILFLGLTFMKDSALQLADRFDLSAYTHYGTFAFVLIGFILTTIIQSSSATIAITLTALYSGAIAFPAAAAVVIGSEVGTTIKILIWGLKGNPEKKRVALANFYFNIFTTIVALLSLNLLIDLITNVFQIKNYLIALVCFQTLINGLSILFFIPLLNIFANWMERQFNNEKSDQLLFIHYELLKIPVLAADAVKNETEALLEKSMQFIRQVIGADNNRNRGIDDNFRFSRKGAFEIQHDYLNLKSIEGNILSYYTQIPKDQLRDGEVNALIACLNAIRNCVYAAKSIKDIGEDFIEFNNSANDYFYKQGEIIADDWAKFERDILIGLNVKQELQFKTDMLMSDTRELQSRYNLELLDEVEQRHLNRIEASTLLNVQREIIAAKKAIIHAIVFMHGQNVPLDNQE